MSAGADGSSGGGPRSPLIDALRPGGGPLYYASYFLGKRFAAEWTVCREGADGTRELATLFELDPTVVGAGGELVRMRSELVLGADLRPLRFRSRSRGARFALDVGATEVTAHLPDGSVRQLPLGEARDLVDSEHTVPWALLLWRVGAGGLSGKLSLPLFHINSLQPAPWAVEPAPELGQRWLRSSHLQELELDEGGLLVTMRVPKQSVEVRRESAPPLPDWREDPALPVRAPLRYRVPDGARFTLRDVDIPGPTTLGASLTIPAGHPPFPAVLYLAGSGMHDRHGFAGDIDLGAHEVVDALSEAGFLGLRYDTRGAGKTPIGDDLFEQGLQTTIDDARAALAYLRVLPEVDARRICLVGHSQGAVVALVLAAGAPQPRLRAVALLAPPGRDLGDILIDQIEAQSRRLGMPESAVAAQVAEIRQFVELTRAGTPFVPGQVPDYLVAAGPTRRWLLDHMGARSLDLITQASCPLLILQGDKDFQVTAEKDAEPLREAAARAGRDVTLVRLPGLDHMFKPVAGESSPATYYERGRHVDADMLAQLAAWLGERARG